MEHLLVSFKNIDEPPKCLRYKVYTLHGHVLHPATHTGTHDIYYLYPGTYVTTCRNINRRGKHYCCILLMRVTQHEVDGWGRYEALASLPLLMTPEWMQPPCRQCWEHSMERLPEATLCD